MAPPGGNQYLLCCLSLFTYVFSMLTRKSCFQSYSPLARRRPSASPVLGLLNVSCFTLILSACQYLGLRAMSNCSPLKALTVNGPVPTAPGLVNLATSLTVDQMCSGTIATFAARENVSVDGLL